MLRLQFTMQLDSTAQQEVRSDPSSNIILHHVQESDLEAWIVDDFNTVSESQFDEVTVLFGDDL